MHPIKEHFSICRKIGKQFTEKRLWRGGGAVSWAGEQMSLQGETVFCMEAAIGEQFQGRKGYNEN